MITEQYVQLGEKLLSVDPVDSRLGPCYSIFGDSLTYDLQESFPVVLCKKLNLKKVFGEMLWMLHGKNNAFDLHQPEYGGSKVWDLDAEAFRKRREVAGLTTVPGDLGRVYGVQWAKHQQLRNLVDLLRKEPSTRRALVTSFSPEETDLTWGLPPCHGTFLCDLSRNVLNLKTDQRSADYLLGLPWNIANYGLLASLLADLLHVPSGKVFHTLGNVHIYGNHLDVTREMIKTWKVSPQQHQLKLVITPGHRSYLEDYHLADLMVVDAQGSSYAELELPIFTAPLNT